MPVTYEWAAEVVVSDEIVDSDYGDLPNLNSLLAWGQHEVASTPGAELHVGVVRYILNAEGEEQDRDYAYVANGVLAETFVKTGKPVPARLRTAYGRATRQ